MTDNTTDHTNFCPKLLLTDREVSKLRKAFAYNSSADINLSKPQISKITQLVGFFSGL